MEDEDGELQTESTSLNFLKEDDNEKSENLVNNEQIDSLSSSDLVPISPKKQNGDVEVKSVDNLNDNDDVGCSDVVNSNRLENLFQNDVQSSLTDNKVTKLVKINKKSELGGKKVKKQLLKNPSSKKLIKRDFSDETLPLTKKIRKIKHNDQNSIESCGEFSRSFINNKKTHMANDVDINQKTKKRKISVDETSNVSIDSNVEIKGFKKPYLNESLPESHFEIQEQTSETDDKLDSDEGEEQNSQLTEYAQYLGLQPTVKFKCYKCDESGFPTMQSLQNHQDTCLKNTKIGCNKPPSLPSSISDTPSTNIRITRKVYLCSVCGTYYENWNLFLHMREVHRRYICLLCLGMFSEPDNLAVHLTNKHGVTESSFALPEEFFSEFTGSFFLMCCTCDRVFSEDEEFFEHECIPVNRKLKGKSDTPCSLCGIKGNHQPNCRKSPFNVAQRQAETQQHKKEQNRKKLLKKNNISDTSKINIKEHEKPENEIIQPSVEIKQSEKGDLEEENDTNTEIIDTSMLENIVGTVPEITALQSKDEQIEDESKLDEKTCLEDSENQNQITLSSPLNLQNNEILETSNAATQPETPSQEDEEETLHIDESQSQAEELKVPEPIGTNLLNEINQTASQEQTDSNELEYIQLAGQDMVATELTLEESLSVIRLPALLKASIRITARTCVYCNHAKKIAVNGKQLALHLLAEHRLSPILQPPGEPAPDDQFVTRLKLGLGELQNAYFNSDTYDNTNKEIFRPDEKVYECFHCHYVTPTQKDLYLHNRKMHQKTILLCIMCKTNFYSYSELLCHLCPGIYDLEKSAFFRCCVCSVDSLPSAFRLMVHLRKRHHACDVCLEITEDQQKLSNHVWKHKLHHLCYRCGIAYRNKPDITKHLFWKHGTESVLCKKCLQKKWPHVYHFCIPPNVFVCEECNASFSRAVALKVHKRLHGNDTPYSCSDCNERFISKKLLARHEEKHRPSKTPPPAAPLPEEKNIKIDEDMSKKEENESKEYSEQTHDSVEKIMDEKEPEKKSKVDIYDLPPLNLSSESDDSEGEAPKNISDATITKANSCELENKTISTNVEDNEPEPEPTQILEGIWDNFKNYKANLERRESQNGPPLFDPPEPAPAHLPYPLCTMNLSEVMAIIINDHDYLGRPGIGPMISSEEETKDSPEKIKTDEPSSLGIEDSIKPKIQEPDKDITSTNDRPITPQDELPLNKKLKSPKKRSKRSASSSSSDSSSNSDSSSCSCGTNCSCSSSSSSSSGSSSDSSDSDSSSSEGRRRQQEKRDKRRERTKRKQEEHHHHHQHEQPEAELSTITNNEDEHINISLEEQEAPIRESELDTDETETDEDFYDKHPQMENKFLAEKRNKLLLIAAAITPPVNNGAIAPTESPLVPATPSLTPILSTPQPETPIVPSSPAVETTSNKRKYRSKKRRRAAPTKPKFADLIKPPLAAQYQNDDSNPVAQDYFNSQALAMAAAAAAIASPTHLPPPPPPASAVERAQSAGSSSENDTGKRLSKRKRVPKRFYGDSSDEEMNDKSPLPGLSVSPAPQPPITTTIKWRKALLPQGLPALPRPPPPSPPPPPPIEPDVPAESYSDSSSGGVNSDSGSEQIATSFINLPPPPPPPAPNKNESLYCYCQCPYDEVSEMIACDGKYCNIEWFHFECVGIMVPPKGKWFCPDCRKRPGCH